MKTERNIILTGAAGGMGSLIAERFLANGDTVIATDISVEGLKALTDKHSEDIGLHSFIADISIETNCEDVAGFAHENVGHIDVLINCAGFLPMTPFAELTLETWNKVIATNLTGPFLMIKAIYPLMKNRGWGRIINFGSASAFEGVADQSPYVAAKAGIFGLSRSLAHEFGGEGITVNIVTPGLTLTPPVRKNMPSALLKSQAQARVLQRDEQPHDLVGAVFFLASPDADFISGQTINVDGGKHML